MCFRYPSVLIMFLISITSCDVTSDGDEAPPTQDGGLDAAGAVERCGDGACTLDETASSCPLDCAAVCGDGACTHTENIERCPGDCPHTCGNGVCEGEETPEWCPTDCPAQCGDGRCTHDETASTCPDDCADW